MHEKTNKMPECDNNAVFILGKRNKGKSKVKIKSKTFIGDVFGWVNENAGDKFSCDFTFQHPARSALIYSD